MFWEHQNPDEGGSVLPSCFRKDFLWRGVGEIRRRRKGSSGKIMEKSGEIRWATQRVDLYKDMQKHSKLSTRWKQTVNLALYISGWAQLSMLSGESRASCRMSHCRLGHGTDSQAGQGALSPGGKGGLAETGPGQPPWGRSTKRAGSFSPLVENVSRARGVELSDPDRPLHPWGRLSPALCNSSGQSRLVLIDVPSCALFQHAFGNRKPYKVLHSSCIL